MKKLFWAAFIFSAMVWGVAAFAGTESNDVDAANQGRLYSTQSYNDVENPAKGCDDMTADNQGPDCEPHCKNKVLNAAQGQEEHNPGGQTH